MANGRSTNGKNHKKPNVLVIFGDDIGQTNISAYSHGVMGYRTPNIDRIAREGMMFTDWYAEQSCTAGRSAFVLGQSPFRSGLSKVGMPGATLGIQPEDPTVAELLKPLGYSAGQFGKNHLGDRDEHLPTLHGFDEFFGNLYHLNAEEEPELPDYPQAKDFPDFRKTFGPRGVLHCWANPDGSQKIEDTGALTRKRMQTVDDEFFSAASAWMKKQTKAGAPWFCWFNTTHMHFRTHVKPDSLGQSGRWQSPYHDAMIDHDKQVGALLDLLDALGVAEDTIVLYTTDNGPHGNSWPDAATSPFRSEKNTNWEGAFRVPAMIRWPGKIKPGSVSNEIVSHLDLLPTILAAAGDPHIKEKLLGAHGRSSSISPTTAIWWRCATTTGRPCSWSSGAKGPCVSGPSRSRRCASPSSSTCGPTPSNGQTSPPTPTGTTCSITRSWPCRRRRSFSDSWPPSASSHRASEPGPSPSTRQWRSSATAWEAPDARRSARPKSWVLVCNSGAPAPYVCSRCGGCRMSAITKELSDEGVGTVFAIERRTGRGVNGSTGGRVR